MKTLKKTIVLKKKQLDKIDKQIEKYRKQLDKGNFEIDQALSRRGHLVVEIERLESLRT